MNQHFEPLENYGLIGDMRTVGLVSKSGSIDWLCLPRIDSDACFAKLLGGEEHGSWSIRCTDRARLQQRYRPETLILETDVECDAGRVRIIDFMPTDTSARVLVRIVQGIEGEVPMRSELCVRFGYGKHPPWVQADGTNVSLMAGPDALWFEAPIAPVPDFSTGSLGSEFTVRAGDRLPFILQYHRSHEDARELELDPEVELARTQAFWREWAGRCNYRGPWREEVVRSLITLKALTHRPTGGLVAAATTSLPEELGGVRNWDYRYCWLRDSALTLNVLVRSGYLDEARAWRDWLLRAAAGAPAELQIMYGVGGESRLTEIELPWLPGYEGSRPVRIGNGAHEQFQLDAYGEVLGVLYQARAHGLPAHRGAWDQLFTLVEFVANNWRRPDEGIWEIRGAQPLHFTYSKLAAWVAVDRAVMAFEEFGVGKGHLIERRIPRWRALRDEIRAEILQRGFDAEVGAFTQAFGTKALDASVLLIPHTGFLPADDPRMLSTVAAIERSLTQDGLVLRYSTASGVDGLPGDEGTFLLCSFWLADNYAMAGRLEEAEALLQRLIGLAGPLGLLAEEYHPGLNRLVGNYPQAFSHVGLVHTAYVIEQQRDALRSPSSRRAPKAAPAA